MGIVLASVSPRRAELLKQIGVWAQVIPSCVAEGEAFYPWKNWVMELAKTKALAVKVQDDDIVLAADTIVIYNNSVLSKPVDNEEAKNMLKTLSGSIHEVMTGICAVKGMGTERKVYQDVETTKVFFRELSLKEIDAYVNSGEPLDKAGAYGIQGLGGLLVERIEGCYFNVVGLPLVKTMKLLRQCGVKVLGAASL